MQEINSKIDVLGSKDIENYASMKKIILELEAYFELSKNEGSKEKIKRARKRNKKKIRRAIIISEIFIPEIPFFQTSIHNSINSSVLSIFNKLSR